MIIRPSHPALACKRLLCIEENARIGATNEPVPDEDQPEIIADPNQESMEF